MATFKLPPSRSKAAGLIARFSAAEELAFPEVINTMREQASTIKKIPNVEGDKEDTEFVLRSSYRSVRYSRFLSYLGQMDCRIFVFFENVYTNNPDVLRGEVAYRAMATLYAYRSRGKVRKPEELGIEGGRIEDVAISYQPNSQGSKAVIKFYFPPLPGILLGPKGRYVQPVREWLQSVFSPRLLKVEDKPGVKCPDPMPGSA